VFVTLWRVHCRQLVGGYEVYGIVEGWIVGNTSLKAVCTAIYLAEELDLKPPLVLLDGFRGLE